MRKKALFVLVSFLILVFSCKNEKQIPFDSEKWKVEKDLETYPYRELMLNDILNNKLFIGYSFSELLDSLGHPENIQNNKNNEVYYLIETDYGWDIDPVYTKYIIFHLDTDSIVRNAIIYEWDKFEKK